MALLSGALLIAGFAGSADASVDSELAFHRGVIAFGDDRYADARAAFQQVLAEDPEDSGAIHYLALIAHAEKKLEESIQLYERALAIDPEDEDVRFDMALAQLDAEQLAVSRQNFEGVIAAEPDRAKAHLFAGIAAYRMQDYDAAQSFLDRAAELDPSVRNNVRYYTALSAASRGDISAAEGALSDLEDDSPMAPLARSAANLRQQMEAGESRPWSLAVTAGIEYDTNPTLAGEPDPLTPAGGRNQRDDRVGVFRLQTSYRLVETEQASVTAGYQGYWSLHEKASIVDLQTHNAWLSGGYSFGPLRLSGRYDFAYTWVDIGEPFRLLNRLTPTLTYREGGWGVTQLYYQFQNRDFKVRPTTPERDLDGTQQTVGVNQFLFVPDIGTISYLRLGFLGDFRSSKGTEFDYQGFEVVAGAGLALPWEVSFTALYRFVRRYYTNPSTFFPFEKQDVYRNRVSVEFVRPVWGGLEVSLAGLFDFVDSNVNIFDYNRLVGGLYFTYRF